MKTLNKFNSDPIAGIIIALIFVISYFSISGEEVEIDTSVKGKIVFEETYFDFGEVTEGDIIKHTFKFKNKGPGVVKIVETKTECGCTTTEAALKAYKPGEQGEMEVTIDTRGKKGITVKTVEVVLENSMETNNELSLQAQLVPPPHPKIENVLAITTDKKCVSCHIESAVGQTRGIFIYHRVCAQCHGKKGVGRSAGPLNDGLWGLGDGSDAFLRNIIEKGDAKALMPPYVQGIKPPLESSQVEELIKYIRVMETN